MFVYPGDPRGAEPQHQAFSQGICKQQCNLLDSLKKSEPAASPTATLQFGDALLTLLEKFLERDAGALACSLHRLPAAWA